MAVTINLTRGRTATFPDGTSEEDIKRILDRDYPLEGVDIDEMVMGDPDFEPTFEQYKLFQQHAYEKDESMFAGMGEGLEHIAGVGWEAAKQLPGMGWDEFKYQAAKSLVPGVNLLMPQLSQKTRSTLAEAGMQGTRELLGMGAQSADPDSVFFRWKSFMEFAGKPTDKGRYEQFKDAREFQRRTLQMEDGRTMSIADIAQLIQQNPEAPEKLLGDLHFDFDDPHTQKRMKELGWEKGMQPEEMVNTDFVKGAKYVTDPSMLIPGLGAAGKGVSLGTKAAGATLRGTGKVMRGAGGGIYRGGIAAGEIAEGAVKSATGVSPGIIRGGAAAVGVTTPGGQLAAGGLAGARATEAVGTVLAKAGEVMAGGPTRRGVFGQVARDLEKGTLEYALARGISIADKPIAIAGQAAEAGIHGGLIGGGLGFMHAGPEGFGPGFGAGFGMGGTIGGVVGVGQLARGKNAMTAKRANDVLNQIKTMEPEQAAMFNEVVAREGIDVAASILDWAAFMEGRLGDGAVKFTFDPSASRGRVDAPSMTAGKPTIEINLAKMDSDYTVGHEIVHGLDHIEDLQPIMHQIRQEIAGMWIDGNMVEQGGMTPLALETRYVEYMHLLAKGEAKKRARRIIGRAEKRGAKLSKEEVSRIHAEEHRNALDKFMKQHSTAEKRALYVADEIMAEHMARLIKGAGPDAGLRGFGSVTRRVLDYSLLKYKGTVLGGMIGRLTDLGIDPYDSMLFKNMEQAPPELNAMLRNLIRARNNLSKQIEVSDVRPDIITKRELKHRLPELKRQGLVKQNDKGDWVLKDDKDIEATEVISETALMDILTKEDPDGFKVERIVDEKTGEVENVVTGRTFSPAQLEAINNSPAILPTVKENIGRLAKAVLDGDILNMDYYAATKTVKNRATGRYRSKYSSGIKKSNRNMLPYTLEVSKAGNFFGKAIDWTVLTNDIIALASKKKLSPWGNDPRAFINDFTAYLTNLATGGRQRSFEIFGEAKADFMHDIMAKKHRGGSKYVKNFRLDRMDGITPTGERARMNPEAWDLSTKRRHMPDTGEAVHHSPREAISGKAESGTALPAMTVITPELAARFMPDVNDPGYASIKGKMAFPMLADRMKVGDYVGRSGKVHELRGGPDHVDIADNLGVVAWAVEGGPIASQLQTAINKTDGVGLVVLQSEQAVSGNRTFGDIMIDELRYDANHRKKTAIDTRIREVVKILKSKKNKKTGKLDYPMLQDVSIKNLDDLAAAHPDMSFDLRGDMFRRIASETHGKTGGIFWRDVMRKVTDYQNKDGYRTGDIVKAIQFEKGDSIVDPKDVGTPVHPSYALAVKGRSLGNIKGRLSAYQVFRDAFNTMGKEKPGRGVSSKGKVGKNAYRSMQMRSLTDPIFRQKVGGKSLAVKSYDKPLEFKAKGGPQRAELAKRSEINKKLGARHMPDVGGQDALGMFSAAERATVNLKQETGSAAQMLAMIKKGGVKQEELAELGLDKFLEGNRKVTKDEIIDHLVENQVTVEETVLGRRDTLPEGWKVQRVPDSDLWHVVNNSGEQVGFAARNREEAVSDVLQSNYLRGEYTPLDTTKHASYVEPGAVEGSYRELLLRLPDRSGKNLTSVDAVFNDFINQASMAEAPMSMNTRDTITRWIGQDRQSAEMIRDLYDFKTSDVDVQFDVLNRFIDWRESQPTPQRPYTGGHYGEHPNVLAHVRFNDRVSDHGKTLNIEEIQSDWHQEGRKKGYQLPAREKASLESEFKSLANDQSAAAMIRRGEIVNILEGRTPPGTGSVPDAPFKTSWHELAMKRMIAYAVQNNYDAISWTKGETQANRYDLSKQVEGIRIHRWDGGNEIDIKSTVGEILSSGFDNSGILRNGTYKGKRLDEVVGKEIAEKILSMPINNKPTTLSGLDLKVGGEGMKGFYDKMLPRMKTWKKLGLKVEAGRLQTEKNRKLVFEVFNERAGTERTAPTVSRHDSPEAAAAVTRGNPDLLWREAWFTSEDATPTHIVRLTPDVKAKVLDSGLARFMPDAAAPNTEKNQLGWSLIKGKSNKWRVYKPDGTLAGIAATKASAERMFRTKYKRELRKGDQGGTARFMPEGRAEAGGQYGKNREFYKGGQFLPSTEMPKRDKVRVRKAAEGKEQFEQGYGTDKYAVPRAGEAPLLRHYSTFMNEAYMERAGFSASELNQLKKLREKYQSGERWFSLSEYPDMANFSDAARLYESGMVIPDAILDKPWAELFRNLRKADK